MAAIVLDGKALAHELEAELRERVENLRALGAETPVLATILVGNDPASATYVRMKGNACRRVGMDSRPIVLGQRTTTEELLAVIDELNDDPSVRGILLQHPTPLQIDERACFDRIAIEKDVDGVTTHGFGRMAMGQPAYGAATPAGIMRLLRHHRIPIHGKHAVIVGRSPILGRPMAMMLMLANATITLCHRHTVGLPELLKPADIVVAALGKREYIRAEWIKDGAVIIDAGFHPGPVGPNGEKMPGTGDVELAPLIHRCSAYTPVPGGVGPMTIVTLIAQTIESAERKAGLKAGAEAGRLVQV